MHDLVPFVQFKKRGRHPWRSVNFSKVASFKPATLQKLTLLHGCFSRFLHCTNGTKSCNAPHILNNFKLISYDVTSLFTSVPLDFRIDIILKRIYDENELNINIPKQQMRDLLLVCIKNVHFSYNRHIYTQADSVAIGSPLGPILAGIFMVELERTVFPTLRGHMSPWKRYVNDTISNIKEESIEHVLSTLNGYHDNIEFTYEIENDEASFLGCTGNT